MLALFSFKKLIKQYPGSPEASIAEDIISQKRWFFYGEFDEAIQFIDATAIRRMNKNTVRVIIKMVPLGGTKLYSGCQEILKDNGIKDWKDYGYSLILEEKDCIERRSAALQFQHCSNDDRTLYIFNAPAKEWQYLAPGSKGERLLEFVCEEY